MSAIVTAHLVMIIRLKLVLIVEIQSTMMKFAITKTAKLTAKIAMMRTIQYAKIANVKYTTMTQDKRKMVLYASRVHVTTIHNATNATLILRMMRYISTITATQFAKIAEKNITTNAKNAEQLRK